MKKIPLIAWTCFIIAGVSHAAEPQKAVGPLLNGLGRLHLPISTKSNTAQRYFNQGVTLSYSFNHKEAIRSFRSAAQFDPDCAMTLWGVAYAYGPHVNKPMNQEDNVQAWKALQKSLALKAKATPREQAMIDALAQRYEEHFEADRSRLDKAYATAMRKVAKQFPDDLDIQTLFAEALMDTMPWDYWTKDRSPKPETEEVLQALKFVLSRDPNHPGANHFYIHAVEAGPQPEIALPAADRLLNYAPTAGHLVHMPSHIYMRVGQYHDAVISNEKAVKADRDYLRQTRSQGFYPGVYYPHNIHFLWWAQLFEGRSKESMKTAQQAARYAVDNYCGPSKALEAPRFRHLPWLTQLRFGRWNDILKLPQPAMTNDFLIDRAVWHFVRGLAFAAKNNAGAAAGEHSLLSNIVASEEAEQLNSPGLPVTSLLAVAEHWLAGRVAEAQGQREKMIQELTKAVELEDAIPYMEPAYWPINVRPALGAALIRANLANRAEAVFREDLKRLPRNGWGLFGLEHSLRAQGQSDSAEVVHRQFEQTWKNADIQLQISWF